MNGAKWVTAQVGDLAIEIVGVKNGKRLGHSYLSGPAIQSNRYTPAQEGWFEDGKLTFVKLPKPPKEETSAAIDAFHERTLTAIQNAKFPSNGPAPDVVTFRVALDTEDDATRAAEFLGHAFRLVPRDLPETEDEKLRVHLIAEVLCRRPKSTFLLHHQPPCHRSDWAATTFQSGLILSSSHGGD